MYGDNLPVYPWTIDIEGSSVEEPARPYKQSCILRLPENLWFEEKEMRCGTGTAAVEKRISKCGTCIANRQQLFPTCGTDLHRKKPQGKTFLYPTSAMNTSLGDPSITWLIIAAHHNRVWGDPTVEQNLAS